MNEIYYFRPDEIHSAIRELFLASGSPADEAELVSGRLVKADLAGHPSHGVIRTTLYMRMIRIDWIKPGATPTIVRDQGSTVLIDGGRAYGQVAAEMAMNTAIERARQHGISAVGVTNLAHIGRLADYAVSAARVGCIGMVYTSCGGAGVLVAPFEGCSRRMSTNPMAVAFPSDGEHPVVLDMATSTWAEGKLRVLKDQGKEAPENVLIDKEGRPTTRTEALYEGGAILPLGGKQGYKGYLLNFMVEALGGLVTGGGYVGMEESPVFNNCSLMIVLDVGRFRELAHFKRDLEGLLTYLKESPTLAGKEVLRPGELEARREAETRRRGIPLAAKTVEALQKDMEDHGVAIRLAELGRPQSFV